MAWRREVHDLEADVTINLAGIEHAR